MGKSQSRSRTANHENQGAPRHFGISTAPWGNMELPEVDNTKPTGLPAIPENPLVIPENPPPQPLSSKDEGKHASTPVEAGLSHHPLAEAQPRPPEQKQTATNKLEYVKFPHMSLVGRFEGKTCERGKFELPDDAKVLHFKLVSSEAVRIEMTVSLRDVDPGTGPEDKLVIEFSPEGLVYCVLQDLVMANCNASPRRLCMRCEVRNKQRACFSLYVIGYSK